MTDKLKAEIRSDEGWKPYVYQDHLGYDTIGYGFCIDPRKTAGLPKPVAEFWLTYLVNERISTFLARWPAFNQQPEDVRDALLNMSYQMGVGGVLNFKKMIAALERGDRDEAKRQALDSTWAKQTPERAKRVADVIGGG